MKKFKKEDEAYIISDQSLIIKCRIIKVTTEDKIKSWDSDSTYKIPKYVVSKSDHFKNNFPVNYPAKMVRISYMTTEGEKQKWIELDSVKSSPQEFLEFVNMSDL